jgi:hypothetical protein
MGTCDVRVGAFARLQITLQVVDGTTIVVGQTTISLPRFNLNSPDPPPGNLKFAGRQQPATQPLTTGGNISTLSYSGSINSVLTLDWNMNFYTDCTGPYCIKGKITGIKADILYEFHVGPYHGLNPNLVETTVTSPDISFGADCKAPEWKLCCTGSQTVEMELDMHPLVHNKLDLTIEDAEATIQYEIWERAGAAEKTHAAFRRTEQRDDGTVRFAVRAGSVHSTVPLPPALGGGVLTIAEAEGYVAVRPGAIDGCMQELEVIELAYHVPSVKLGAGESGPIQIALAPGERAYGHVDHCTGMLNLTVPQVIRAPVFAEADIRVASRVTGFFDAATGDAHIVTLSFDEFPELPTKPPAKKG